jgi:hypothetical protein
MKMPILLIFALGLLVLGFGFSAFAEEAAPPSETDKLPGYYEFFMKSGELTRIKPELERDLKIEAGAIKPMAMDQPLPELALPLASGEKLKFNQYLDKRNLLIVSFRSWW